MGGKRQKTRPDQPELAFTVELRGEAPRAAAEGTELPAAKHATESPVEFEKLMEEIVQSENLEAALQRVRENRGSPGADGMTVEQLGGYWKQHGARVVDQLLSGTYQPQPVKRAEIPKEGGGMRQLGIPTVLDRMIQQAVMQVLQQRWDATFSEYSYGFRPGRSAQQAVAQVQKYLAEGYRWVVDIDVEKFFDRVNHDMLMGLLAKRISDKRVLELIRAFLNAGVLENGLVSPIDEGTPQGGPLSPLLSNIVLDVLDRELEKRGHRFARYADDCNIYVRSQRAGERVMASITRFLGQRLKLRVNGAKSKVARPWQVKFLGFSFTNQKEPRRRIAPQALDRLKRRVRQATRRTRGVSIADMVKALGRYLSGWRGYFSFCETPSVLCALDSWIRRRLRSVVWKQWKRGRVRFRELRARGVGKDLAAQTAGSCHGPWRLARSPALSFALPNAYWVSLGLPTLAARPAA